MKKVLITGISSGIGKALTKLLIQNGFTVWGIGRRQQLLERLKKELNSQKFFYTAADITADNFWDMLMKKLTENKFTPDTIILNAAVHKNDLEKGINLKMLREIMEVNFFSNLKGVKIISKHFTNKLHFITISSTSAFKGNHEEGIGYAASKGALSIAFESLFQKYFGSRITFTTIFFGPVMTKMVRLKKAPPLILSPDQAAEFILSAISSKKPFLYYPRVVFIILSIMRLLPNQVFFRLWSRMQKPYNN